MLQKVVSLTQKYERHLSAVAMVFGFVLDSFFFGRVDVWETHLVFALYALVCFATIPSMHWLQVRGKATTFANVALPMLTQFALGGFWSGFVVFYGRSASVGASWPFLLFLIFVLLGTEYFRRYHSRLVFTSILFFFALYSYAIFAVPIYTGSIGTLTFLMSGGVAILAFAAFTGLLRMVARERFLDEVWRIRAGAVGILVVMHIFYAANILPPLPLSVSTSGIYHSVVRAQGVYEARREAGQSWGVRYLGFSPTLHVVMGDTVAAYSSVFAPTALTTSIMHRWQWYNRVQNIWVTKSVIMYSIVGGRDGGYRGYTNALIDADGEWRVEIETADGRLLTRLPFTVVFSDAEPSLEKILLK